MHELGITQGIVERARETARQAGAVKVTDLFLTITPAADFQPESIEMYFEMLTDEDGLLKGATLHFASASIAATCLACGEEFPTETSQPVCPACGSRALRSPRGDDPAHRRGHRRPGRRDDRAGLSRFRAPPVQACGRRPTSRYWRAK